MVASRSPNPPSVRRCQVPLPGQTNPRPLMRVMPQTTGQYRMSLATPAYRTRLLRDRRLGRGRLVALQEPQGSGPSTWRQPARAAALDRPTKLNGHPQETKDQRARRMWFTSRYPWRQCIWMAGIMGIAPVCLSNAASGSWIELTISSVFEVLKSTP
jgi:hypothetical protein